jgi:hypothetical protein
MANIPAGTKFIGIGASVPTPENKSSQNNGFQEVYTIDDLQENVLDLTTPPDEGDVLTYTSGAPAWAPTAGGSDYTETIVNITSAQILAIGTTPVTLLPAPGSGMYYDIDKVIIEYTHNTNAYTSSDYLMMLGVDAAYAYPHPNLITSAKNMVVKFSPSLTTGLGAVYADEINTSVSLTTEAASNPTLGDGTLRVKIYHKTITFGA